MVIISTSALRIVGGADAVDAIGILGISSESQKAIGSVNDDYRRIKIIHIRILNYLPPCVKPALR